MTATGAAARLSALLVERGAGRYRGAGSFAYHFARGKLGYDPLFMALLEHAAIPDAFRLVDLGCGQGLLASWLRAADESYQRGSADEWPADWPAPPKVASYFGVDRSRADVERARHALGDSATVEEADLATIDAEAIGRCDVTTLIDVLHYLDRAQQERLLRVVRDCLQPQGTLVVRVGDGDAVHQSLWSNTVDFVVSFFRGHPGRLHRRSIAEWLALLDGIGFDAHVVHDERKDRRTNPGSRFANVIVRARLRADATNGLPVGGTAMTAK